MSKAFFEQVVEALIGFLPPELADFSSRVTSHNAKIWFGAEAREHYEVQAFRHQGRPRLEIGFHVEHADAVRSDAAIAPVLAAEREWRTALGPDVQAGKFLGRTGSWRRASETWDDADLADPGAAVEAADRLSEYIAAFEPLRAAG